MPVAGAPLPGFTLVAGGVGSFGPAGVLRWWTAPPDASSGS